MRKSLIQFFYAYPLIVNQQGAPVAVLRRF
jgi:hypothetical protein